MLRYTMIIHYSTDILLSVMLMLIIGQVKTEGEFCQSSDGTNGICITLNSCHKLKSLVRHGLKNHKDITCGWKDHKTPLVCCPPTDLSNGSFPLTKPIHSETPMKLEVILPNGNVTRQFPSDKLKEAEVNSPNQIPFTEICKRHLNGVFSEKTFDYEDPPEPMFQKKYFDEIQVTTDVSKPAYDFEQCGGRLTLFGSRPIDVRSFYCLNETIKIHREMGYTVTPLKIDVDKLLEYRVSNATHQMLVNDYPSFGAVGGEDADRELTIYMAVFGYTTRNITEWLCDGVIINRNWILSAAHCFIDRDPDIIRLGEYDLSNDATTALEYQMDFGVKGEAIFYPKYQYPSSDHDLALIQLDRAIPFHRRDMRPVCLPWDDEVNRSFIDETLTLTGWGATTFGSRTSSVIQEVNVTAFEASVCNESYSNLNDFSQKFPNGIRPEMFLCAGDVQGGKDACQGDSGGPLVYQNEIWGYTLAGIVSTGFGCGLKEYPGLYIPINRPEYLKWIKQVAF